MNKELYKIEQKVIVMAYIVTALAIANFAVIYFFTYTIFKSLTKLGN